MFEDDSIYTELPELLSPQAVSGVLGVTVETLAIWRSTGRYRLPFVKVGRKVMYRPGDVEQFIDRRWQEHT